MTLYKNVDICDLKSIVEKGILSLEASRNNNWEDGKRANNDATVVYLFSPAGEQNSFTDYGTALLEVETNAKEKEMRSNDVHLGEYKEYVVKKVSPQQIKRIIIPEAFKDYVDIPSGINITWCRFKAQFYKEDSLEDASENVIAQFAKTAPLMDSTWYNFFRGKRENGELFDLYNIQYVF